MNLQMGDFKPTWTNESCGFEFVCITFLSSLIFLLKQTFLPSNYDECVKYLQVSIVDWKDSVRYNFAFSGSCQNQCVKRILKHQPFQWRQRQKKRSIMASKVSISNNSLAEPEQQAEQKTKTQEEEDEEIWEKVETIQVHFYSCFCCLNNKLMMLEKNLQDKKFDMLKIILNLVKQFHSGMDIHKIQAPVHIIKPRSFLEETHFYIHPHRFAFFAFFKIHNHNIPIQQQTNKLVCSAPKWTRPSNAHVDIRKMEHHKLH